jgi:hypothetical protein
MSEKPKIRVQVTRKTIQGQEYLMSINKILYDPETKEEVGLWDEENNRIKALPDLDDDDEDDMENIMFEGKRYVIDKSNNDAYNGNTNQLVGKWNEKKKRIDFDEYDEDEKMLYEFMDDDETGEYMANFRFTINFKLNKDDNYEIKNKVGDVVSYIPEDDVDIKAVKKEDFTFRDIADIGMPLTIDIQHTYPDVFAVGLNIFAGNNATQVKDTNKFRYPIYWNGTIVTKDDDDYWKTEVIDITMDDDLTSKPIGSIEIELENEDIDIDDYEKEQLQKLLFDYVRDDAYTTIMKKAPYASIISEIETKFLDSVSSSGKKKEKKIKEKKEKVVVPPEPEIDVMSIKVNDYKIKAAIYKTKKAEYEVKKSKELKAELTKLKADIEKLLEEIKALKEGKGLVGGKLGRDELKGLLDASYDGRERVGDWVIDKQLSTKTSKVYANNEGRAVVAHRGTEGITDWGNNLAFAVGGEYLYKKTDRFK